MHFGEVLLRENLLCDLSSRQCQLTIQLKDAPVMRQTVKSNSTFDILIS